MSGRIAAVDAVEEDGRITLFVGAASGGVWKSVNGGTTFKPVFDREDVQSIGAVAIDPSNSKTVWVGSGEGWSCRAVCTGASTGLCMPVFPTHERDQRTLFSLELRFALFHERGNTFLIVVGLVILVAHDARAAIALVHGHTLDGDE